MSNWKEYKLVEVAKNASRRFDFSKHSNVIFINTGDVLNNQFLHKNYSIADGLPGQAKKAIQKGDILYSEIRPGNGRYLLVGDSVDDYVVSTKFMVIESNQEIILPEFLFLLLISNEATEYFKVIAESRSGTFPQITFDSISHYELKIPSKDIQQSIVDNIFVLDKKIELNTQINQTLEQIAQTIFKSWFIDFDPVHAKANALASGQTAEQATQAAMAVISGKNTQELHRLQTANPEQYQQLWEIAEAFPSGFDEESVPRGWEERELSSLFEFLSGAQPPKSEHIYEEKEGYERFIQNRDYSNDNHKTYIPISKKNKRCTEKDILMDKYGEAGKVRYGIKGAYNVALAKIVPQKDNLREFLRSYFTQDKIRNYLSSSSMASTRNSLNSTTFTGMKVIVPNDFLLSTFDKLANEKIDKTLQIKQENIELSKLRDYLLPKLLSGEVLNGN